MKPITEIVSHFKKARKISGNGYMVLCPCHADKNASLHITDKGDKILLKCQAGCNTSDIIKAAGLTFADLGSGKEKPAATWRNKVESDYQKQYGNGAHIVAVYDYQDKDGNYLYSKIRLEGGSIDGKTFVQGKIMSSSFFKYGIQGIPKTLYNLPALIKAISEGFPVYYVEGEKDVETLRKIGLTATTVDGANGWKKEYSKFFIGATVYIISDNDKPGIKLSKDIQKDLYHAAFYTTIVKPSSKEGGDVTDYLNDNHSKDDLLTLIKESKKDLGIYAPCYSSEGNGKPKVHPAILADSIRKTTKIVMVRPPAEENPRVYTYNDAGYYQECSKSMLRALVCNYIPLHYRIDNQINSTVSFLTTSNDTTAFDAFNSDENYINFANGLYNIKTRRLEQHSSEKLSTLQLSSKYILSDTSKPAFDAFISDLCRDTSGKVDTELMNVIQEYCGLCISNVYGYRVKKALILCSLEGNTGKSVLLNLMTDIIGHDYVVSIPFQNMTEKNKFDLGSLVGKRLIINGDQTNSDVEDSSIFKELTGGDQIKIEQKYRQPFFMTYKGCILTACNGLPSFQDDKGSHIFDRLLLIPCRNVIPEEKRDRNLLDKLKNEKAAIIIWMLEGLHRLIDNGYKFTESKAITETLNDYHSRIDTVYRFIKEGGYLITGNHADRIKKTDFENDYNNYCDDNGFKAVSKNNISNRMESIGIICKKTGGLFCYVGIKKNEDAGFIDVSGIDENPFS